ATIEAEPLDFEEPFDTNGVPPPGWNIVNPDSNVTWAERSNITGSDGSSTVTAFMNNFAYNAAGQEDLLETLFIDLTNATSARLDIESAEEQVSVRLSDAL